MSEILKTLEKNGFAIGPNMLTPRETTVTARALEDKI